MTVGFDPVATIADTDHIETIPLAQRNLPASTYAVLANAAAVHGNRNALTYLPHGESSDEPHRYSYTALFS